MGATENANQIRRGYDAFNQADIPTLTEIPGHPAEDYAATVLERFANPFVKHQLLSIALNSTSKFKARVLPSIREYVKRKGGLPRRLTSAACPPCFNE